MFFIIENISSRILGLFGLYYNKSGWDNPRSLITQHRYQQPDTENTIHGLSKLAKIAVTVQTFFYAETIRNFFLSLHVYLYKYKLFKKHCKSLSCPVFTVALTNWVILSRRLLLSLSLWIGSQGNPCLSSSI